MCCRLPECLSGNLGHYIYRNTVVGLMGGLHRLVFYESIRVFRCILLAAVPGAVNLDPLKTS